MEAERNGTNVVMIGLYATLREVNRATNAISNRRKTSARESSIAMIVLASPSANAVVRWKEALCGFGPVQTISQMGLLRTTLQREKPLVMLLDLALAGPDGCAAVQQLLSLSRTTRC